MEESYGIEPYLPFRAVAVFETATDHSVLLSILQMAENRRIERRHPFQGVTVFKTDAHH